MYGGGETGDEYVAVTSTGIVLLTCAFVAISERLTETAPLSAPVSYTHLHNAGISKPVCSLARSITAFAFGIVS